MFLKRLMNVCLKQVFYERFYSIILFGPKAGNQSSNRCKEKLDIYKGRKP